MHDFVDGYDTYTEKPGCTWPADVAFADVNPAWMREFIGILRAKSPA